MARATTVFACTTCGHQQARWHGRCPGCSAWNTLVEERVGAPHDAGSATAAHAAQPRLLRSVTAEEVARLATGVGELDRLLGGGIVPGSMVLLGGAPGIGKSTLTSMALGELARAGRRTLYVSAEESAAQVRLRAQRLSPAALEVPIVAETALDVILATLEAQRPEVCVIDSIQTLHAPELSGAPGTVGQVREATAALMRLAKDRGVAMILVGHVTKEGSLAGPRVLEHLVDCVLQFEGESERSYRTLRALKNRFGSTDELAVFEMGPDGLSEVADASARFVAEASGAPGSVVLAALEAGRPLLVEVQALVSPSELVPPRRVVNGLDRNRLALVLAVLARHAGLPLGGADVFVNVVGGVRVEEPGADLAVALAVAGAAHGAGDAHLRGGRALGADGSPLAGRGPTGERPLSRARPVVCCGEIGLAGELRAVAGLDRRAAEAARFGLGPLIAPGDGGPATVAQAVRAALGGRRTRAAA